MNKVPWEDTDTGENGGAMEPASDGEKGGARMPGEPAEEREEGPWDHMTNDWSLSTERTSPGQGLAKTVMMEKETQETREKIQQLWYSWQSIFL